jgi:hypothetical protein
MGCGASVSTLPTSSGSQQNLPLANPMGSAPSTSQVPSKEGPSKPPVGSLDHDVDTVCPRCDIKTKWKHSRGSRCVAFRCLANIQHSCRIQIDPDAEQSKLLLSADRSEFSTDINTFVISDVPESADYVKFLKVTTFHLQFDVTRQILSISLCRHVNPLD